MATTRKAAARVIEGSASESPRKPVGNEKPVEFEYDNQTYILPPTEDWDLEVFEFAEDQKMASACKALLGPTQWATFKSKPRKMRDLIAIYEAAWGAVGVNPED